MLATTSSTTPSSSLWLPAPTKTIQKPRSKQQPKEKNEKSSSPPVLELPTYEERCNASIKYSSATPQERKEIKLFVPRTLDDYNDGGSYPEIHVAQYPRNMGNPHLAKKPKVEEDEDDGNNNRRRRNRKNQMYSSSGAVIPTSNNLINLEIDEKGDVSYDAIVKGGTNSNKTVYSKHSDMLVPSAPKESIELPSSKEEEDTTKRTQEALNALISSSTQALNPKGVAMLHSKTSQNVAENTDFIQYAPNESTPGYNPAAKQRIIQLVPAQIDPMAPPSFTIQKAPRGPADDPVPILHAPPAKLTAEEKAEWQIPACISNWKNTRGYTIPLDKRLAADGRGLRDTSTINPNFATLSESLYIAERQAREEVRMRSLVQKRLAEEEKERKEEQLRNLAQQARLHRVAPVPQPPPTKVSTTNNNKPTESILPDYNSSSSSDNDSDIEEDTQLQKREQIRVQQKKQHERDLRDKNNKRKFESERDVSEQIALGQHAKNTAPTVDTRLYNTSSGLDSGFAHGDDEYTTYSKGLYDDKVKNIYKPSVMEDDDDDVEELKEGKKKTFVRSGPVQFEKS